MTAVLRHKTTNVLYRHVQGNVFRNIATGIEGEVPDDIAQKIFAINTDATEMFNEYPLVEKLVKALNLKIETITRNDVEIQTIS